MPRTDRRRVIQRFIERLFRPRNASRSIEGGALTARLPATHIEAAKSLTDWGAMDSTTVLDRQAKVSFGNTHPAMVHFYMAFQRELKRRGIPMYGFEFNRSNERQARLYRQGVTKAKPGQSPHNHGLAFDLVSAVHHWNLTKKQWDIIGAIGKEVARKMGLKVQWGGDWKFYDPAHWEIDEWRLWAEYNAGQPWQDHHLYRRGVDWPVQRGDFRKWKKARA